MVHAGQNPAGELFLSSNSLNFVKVFVMNFIFVYQRLSMLHIFFF
jgi:hypothetical protein